jgi:hypothetical protein
MPRNRTDATPTPRVIRPAQYRDPVSAIPWETLDLAQWWLPPEATSLYGSAEFDALSDAARRRLSQFEFALFAATGLWLESVFLERVGRMLADGQPAAVRAVLLAELREEAGHSLMFVELLDRATALGIALPPIRFPAFARWLGRSVPAGSLLFWTAMVLGEDVPDRVNRVVRRHETSGVHPVTAAMCRIHAIDEARHLSFSRARLAEAWAAAGPMARRSATLVASRVLSELTDLYFLPPASLYVAAGLGDGRRLRIAARASTARQAFIRRCVEPAARLLAGMGMPVRMHLY